MRKIIFTSILILVVVSCIKETLGHYSKSSADLVLAGAYDESYTHKVYSPGFSVNLKQIGCWEMAGSDSIDINGDGIYDLILSVGDLNDTPYAECCPQSDDPNILIDCMPAFFQYYQVATSDSFEILAEKVIDDLSSGMRCFIDTLNLNDTISKRNNWSSERKLYFYDNNKSPMGGYGKWVNIKSPKYLGFKFSAKGINKYGWIKIERTNKLIITEFAYKK